MMVKSELFNRERERKRKRREKAEKKRNELVVVWVSYDFII